MKQKPSENDGTISDLHSPVSTNNKEDSYHFNHIVLEENTENNTPDSIKNEEPAQFSEKGGNIKDEYNCACFRGLLYLASKVGLSRHRCVLRSVHTLVVLLDCQVMFCYPIQYISISEDFQGVRFYQGSHP